MIRNLTLAAALLAPVSVAAQELPTAPYLPLELAQTAAQTALEACAAEGHNVSVAIVARSGVTTVILRADNAGPHTVGSSTGKAFTSASMGRDTAGLAGFIGENPANNGLRDMDDGPQRIEDPEELARVRRQALVVNAKTAAIGLLLTTLALLP